MNCSIIIATYGSPDWADLAGSHAFPSTEGQGAHQVIVDHDAEMYLDEIRNSAAEQATGDWLCFLDADDTLAPGYLEAMAATADLLRTVCDCGYEGDMRLHCRCDPCAEGFQDRAAAAEGRALLVPRVQYHREGVAVGAPFFPNRERPIDEMNHCVIGTLIPTALFKQVGGFGDEPLYEDWALFLRCIRAGAELVYVEDAVYNAYLRDEGRNSSAPYTLQRAVYRQIREAHLAAT